MTIRILAAAAALGIAACASATSVKPPSGPIPGKWKSVVYVAGMTLPPQEECMADPFDFGDAAAMPPADGDVCGRPAYTAVEGGFDGLSVCSDGGRTTRIEMRVRGDFTSDITVELLSYLTPLPEGAGPGPGVVRIEMERIGDC
jgi:hypothetical protein